ncbi:MAG TPA: DUF58 domain-containing protein [Dehalococcoidia bacterium]|nr:DUF58 domain-containing protein [Dehalococcoidia bacterium]
MWLNRVWLQLTLALFVLGIVLSNGAVIGLAIFMMAAGFLARFWARHALDNVTYERIIPENRAFQGENISVTLRLVNDKMLPVPWIELRDAVPEATLTGDERTAGTGAPGYVHTIRSTHLSWYERISWPLELKAVARGHYRVGPARLTTGDVFGFNPVVEEQESHQNFIVYPRVYELPELGLPAERPFGELKGRQRIFEDPGRIAGVRDYQPGDSMRRIDWKASARRQTLQSKVYEPSATMHLLLAVNVNTMLESWQGFQPELLERLLAASASVAKHAFESGYSVGLVANGSYPDSDRPMRVPVGRNSDQLGHVLEALAVIHPLTMASLETVIDTEAARFPYGATLVCVTSQMDDNLAGSLERVSRAGHTVTVISLAEKDGEFDEMLPGIRVHNIAQAMHSLEARDGVSIAEPPPEAEKERPRERRPAATAPAFSRQRPEGEEPPEWSRPT